MSECVLLIAVQPNLFISIWLQYLIRPVWPDAEIKSNPNVSKSCPKISHSWFNSKINVFQKSPKSHSPTFRRKCVAKNFQKLPNLVTLNQTRSGTDPINKFLRKFDSFTIFKHLDWLKILSILSDCFKN